MVFKLNDFLKDNLHKLHCNYTLHYILKLVIKLLYHFFLQKHFFKKTFKNWPTSYMRKIMGPSYVIEIGHFAK